MLKVASTFMSWGWKFGNTPVGRFAGTATGVGSSFFLMNYQDKYGAGGAFAIGAALGHPIIGFPASAIEIAGEAGEFGMKQYKQRRALNLFKSQQDRYNNVKQMRQASINALSRNRINPSRMMGNEGFYFHR